MVPFIDERNNKTTGKQIVETAPEPKNRKRFVKLLRFFFSFFLSFFDYLSFLLNFMYFQIQNPDRIPDDLCVLRICRKCAFSWLPLPCD